MAARSSFRTNGGMDCSSEYTLPVVHQERRDVRDGHRSMSVTMKCDVWTLAIPRLRILFTGKWL